MSPVATDAVSSFKESFGVETTSLKAKLPLPASDHSTLPAQWMRDESIFELEKRAIFSKVWLLTSHTSHFSKPGDYISGNNVFDYFIIRDKDDNYQAFHNVCRHRAYPVVSKSEGSSLVIGCKYHGWSYNAKGDLVKAPKFDTVPGFDKKANGLFKIHTHVTTQGFIFLNFDASPNPVPFEDHFAQLPAEWKDTDFTQYEPYYYRQVVGNFNWKTMSDGYQECYHCTIAHPGFSQSLDLTGYTVEPLSNSARHTVPLKSNPEEKQSFVFIFPTHGVTVAPEVWYILRSVPLSATKTRMEFDVFRRKGVPEEVLLENRKFYTQVQQEDFDLCENAQRGLNAGIYHKGVLHPEEEKGVLYYQSRVLDFCQTHLQLERQLGKVIYPARPLSQDDGEAPSCEASRLCAELDANGTMSW
ncbi:Rieske [2Fe-2S] domain protein [Fomitiporia mediterranea MF3/22]|uniref:Rieske [2Fe-2S] domain protein n=1 Tax=Fomitiporia mediterranea (strain MF3/22) TaxID=694068 RepID=UPI0004407AFB|nr:Rieske [2Fe-2S] domain protein [Fomitiporia mediterranea MF3/22]EJD06366.1 Rieske [2Fe-2S] domain protein [Fomitiporia mediterranea MF3/22]